MRSCIRSDAATADGATRTPTTSYLCYHDVFEEAPDAAGPWTGAAVVAMEIGVDRDLTMAESRVTTVAAEVLSTGGEPHPRVTNDRALIERGMI